jgi:hypothetical protein
MPRSAICGGLLVHRHGLVRMGTQVKNQLQTMALNQGVQKKRQLWSAKRS